LAPCSTQAKQSQEGPRDYSPHEIACLSVRASISWGKQKQSKEEEFVMTTTTFFAKKTKS
jgi:hypothetical protein